MKIIFGSKAWLVAAVAASALAAASSASATDFSFTGTFAADNDVQFFDFSVGADSLVTLRTWSYAGGVNAAGQNIARGGFDPILSLYDLGTGDRVGQNDDGGCGQVAADAVSGRCWDTLFQSNLTAGNYRVAVSQFANFGPDHIPGAFPGSGTHDFIDFVGNQRDAHWAFDVLNVADATQVGVPEPATWALMIGGFGLAGASLRRRRALAA